MIAAIDPGPVESAYVLLDGSRPHAFGKVANHDMLATMRHWDADSLAIEMIASYGMPVGAEVFETCVWIGRFLQAWQSVPGDRRAVSRVLRQTVKLHLCKSPKANDATIRQALLDLYGGKDKAIGRKATPGPLYGISGDVWSALAVAITHRDLLCASRETTEAA